MNQIGTNTKKKVLVVAIFIILVMGCGLHLLSVVLKIDPNAPYLKMSVQTVGVACLLYIQDKGEVPRSLGDLFSSGYLKEKPNGLIEVPLKNSFHVGQTENVFKVHLSFPQKVHELKIENHCLIEKATGKERFILLTVPSNPSYLNDLRETNIWVWQRWQRMEQGNHHEEWLKE